MNQTTDHEIDRRSAEKEAKAEEKRKQIAANIELLKAIKKGNDKTK